MRIKTLFNEEIKEFYSFDIFLNIFFISSFKFNDKKKIDSI